MNATLEATFSITVGTDLMRVDKITGPWPSEEKLILNAEFLIPERALPRFPIDTIAQALLRDTFIGTVRVLSANAPASTE